MFIVDALIFASAEKGRFSGGHEAFLVHTVVQRLRKKFAAALRTAM
jgi:hypothetical protein